ncbi:MAG: type IX secretion system outer membrane channel protein PorV, partial [Cyclobacteriaceae bacterium]|nr:type IX secretion system outer membrane channel protein PorV [Cyclobacteriaceae bacterium]
WLGKIIDDMYISYLSGYHKITREQVIGFSMRYFDLGDIFFTGDNGEALGDFNPREFAFDAGYSRLLSEHLSIGVVLRYIHSNLTGSFASGGLDAQPGNTAAGDVGIYYTRELMMSGKESDFSLGANISNIGGKITYSNEDNLDFLPTNLKMGTAYTTHFDPYNKITLALDLSKLLVPSPPLRDVNTNAIIRGKEDDRPMLSGVFGSFGDAPDGFREEIKEFMMSVAAEYWYNNSFAGRAGYFTENAMKGNRKYFTLGLGLRYQMFGIDFAYLVPQKQNHPLAETLRFTILIKFEDKETPEEEDSVTN